MANDEKKQDQRDGIAHRLGGWVHVAVIACYMAVLFVQLGILRSIILSIVQ